MRRRVVELTRRGWSLCGAACGLVVASRLLGVVQLLALGVAAFALLGASLLWVRARRPRLDLARAVEPARLQVGGDGRIDLTVTNVGHSPTPLLVVDESFGDGGRAARFLLQPLDPGACAEAAYRVPTTRRGHHPVGPTVVTVGDPFGLAQAREEIGGPDHVVVHPRLLDLTPPPLGGTGLRSAAEAQQARTVALEGDEFATLREYVIGDDLRKVHWPATARTGDLFIRHDTTAREPHVLVVLDTRAEPHDDDSFEVGVEIVASLLVAGARQGRRVQVRAADATNLGRTDDVAVALDRLAAVTPVSGQAALRLDAGSERAPALLVVVTGRVDDADRELVRRAARPGRPLVVVTTLAGGAPLAPLPAVTHVEVGRTASSGPADRARVAAAWNGAVAGAPADPDAARARDRVTGGPAR